MYIIDDTYFFAPFLEVPNIEEADSKQLVQLEMMIDDKCRLFMRSVLTDEELAEFESYLVNGIFTPTDDTPEKWIDLMSILVFENGTYKGSLLADYVYYYWLIQNATFLSGMGEAKGDPKGMTLVNLTQKTTQTWNSFVKKYYELLSKYDFTKEVPQFKMKNQLGL